MLDKGTTFLKSVQVCVFIMGRELGGICKKGCRVVRDKEIKLEDGEVSHTLGGVGEGGT